MVSVSPAGPRGITGWCRKISRGNQRLKTNQHQKSHRRFSFAPKFLFIVLLIRMAFFLPIDKFSMDDYMLEQERHRREFARKKLIEKATNEFEYDGTEVEKTARVGNLEHGKDSDKMEDINEEKGEILALVKNSENREPSTEARIKEEGKGEYSTDFQKSEDKNESTQSKNTEEETLDTGAASSSEEESEHSGEYQPSKDELRSTEDNSAEEEDDMYFRDPNATVVDWAYFPQSMREPRRDASWNEAKLAKSASFTLDKTECELFMNNVDTLPPPLRKPSNKACEGYEGVFHIQHFDQGAASGTAFFLFTIGMLAWADQHNYLPWIHIEDGYTKAIWDPIVHTNSTKPIEFEMRTGMEIGWARDPKDTRWHIFPGKPYRTGSLHPRTFVLEGTGVWDHYFLPPNDFVPGDSSCVNKPIVKMNEDHIVPGIHSNAPWAPRAWRYVEAPYILLRQLSWDEWFKPQRKRGAEITKRYIRFNPMMERRAHCAFPNPEFSLGMHIRHGDKYIERDVIETDRFLEFAEAFVNNGGGPIYVATDSAKVIKTVLEDWPKNIANHVVHQSSVKGLTSNQTAAFDLGVSAHRTNVEALTDVLALSKSTFLLHGLSAMSEAVLYLNPGLTERSINLEDELYKDFSPELFVKTMMPLGKA